MFAIASILIALIEEIRQLSSLLRLLLLIAFADPAHHITQISDLKSSQDCSLMAMAYIDDYFSGSIDLRSLWINNWSEPDGCNLGKPSDEWIRISSRSENLNEAIASI
jgi:hypothetical protein